MNNEYEVKKQTQNQLNIDYENKVIFLRNNQYKAGNVTNSGYDTLSLEAGTLMGRVTATNKLTPLKSGASDGSQIPVGILAANYEIAAGDNVDVQVCVAGEVDQSNIIFDGSDTVDTTVDGRKLGDRIASDTAGIILIPSEELDEFDNN